MNIDNIETATSVARREGSGSFAAGGGDVSPGNSRLGQRQTGPKTQTAIMMHGAWSIIMSSKSQVTSRKLQAKSLRSWAPEFLLRPAV
jgi:hypothetical protein